MRNTDLAWERRGTLKSMSLIRAVESFWPLPMIKVVELVWKIKTGLECSQ
jgi:hypothetical protein